MGSYTRPPPQSPVVLLPPSFLRGSEAQG